MQLILIGDENDESLCFHCLILSLCQTIASRYDITVEAMIRALEQASKDLTSDKPFHPVSEFKH